MLDDYLGVGTKRTRELLDRVELKYNIILEINVQPTHCFDFNATDALGHSCIKRYMRSRRVPRHVRDFNLAMKHGLTDRAIKRSFMRAYSKTAKGDTGESHSSRVEGLVHRLRLLR